MRAVYSCRGCDMGCDLAVEGDTPTACPYGKESSWEPLRPMFGTYQANPGCKDGIARQGCGGDALTNSCLRCGRSFDFPNHVAHRFEDSTIHVFSCPHCNAVFHHHETGIDRDEDFARCSMALDYVERTLSHWGGSSPSR